MIPEEIWYFFVFPWIAIIGGIPGIVITYMALGGIATLSGFLPDNESNTIDIDA